MSTANHLPPSRKGEVALVGMFCIAAIVGAVLACNHPLSPTPNDQRPATDVPITFTAPSEMTLRDWFAGQWLAGQTARTGPSFQRSTANMAYEWADAMLRARQIEVKDE